MKSFKLFDFKNLDFSNLENSTVRISKLQRGLVWKPHQVELLWDSILRGFPIGSFTILKNNNLTEMIDGQQRLKAIVDGFSNPNENNQSIVWIDLKLNLEGSSRKYGIRVTTKAHPWGYHLDGSTLNTTERYDAITNAGYKPGSKKSSWNLMDFIPYTMGDTLPIPLSFFLTIDRKEPIKDLKEKCNNLSDKWKCKYLEKISSIKEGDNYKQFLKVLKAIESLSEFEIPIIELEDDTNLDILFERIGTGGTNIKPKELSYAAMKFYLISKIENLVEINQKVSKNLMPEADFAMTVLRLYLSNKEHIKDFVSIDDVRNLNELSEERDNLIQAYKVNSNGKSEIEYIFEDINKWLTYDNFPAVIRSEIYYNYSELYIFLLWVARQFLKISKSHNDSTSLFMRALAYYLYICVNKYPSSRKTDRYKPVVIDYMYRILNQKSYKDPQDILSEITNMLKDLIGLGYCLFPSTPEFFESFKAIKIKAYEQWNLNNYSREPNYYLFLRLFTNNTYSQFLLKLYQKDYYSSHFADYDPSRKDLWADTNRPWDHDHIIPTQWGDNKNEWTPFINQLINSIGNLADIPYELNRSKGNRCSWDHYEENNNPELLLSHINKGKEALETIKQMNQKNLIEKRDVLFDFVKNRFLEIYKSFYEIISVLKLNALPDLLSKRQKFLNTLKVCNDLFMDYDLYYLAENEKEIKFESNNEYGWWQPWISLCGKPGKQYMPAVTVGFIINNKDIGPTLIIEIGNRKRADLSCSEISPNPTWWSPNTCKNIDLNTENLELSIINHLDSIKDKLD